LKLSETGRQKFLNHFARLKAQWGVRGNYKVSSANNFPADCGIASSASSFAAVTLAAYQLAKSQNAKLDLSMNDLSKVSRLGSGSSCRSFFSPWSIWRDEGGEAWDCPLRLEHAVILVADEKKAVSSSQAHALVNSSLLFQGRVERAGVRLNQLQLALQSGDWGRAFELCWSEFWDMHALFETSEPSFGYMTAKTLEVLERTRLLWRSKGDGPLVTMDAGANVHLLFRPEQVAVADQWLGEFNAITSWGRP
jgi:diphosphomevalonate decarboxylase